MDSITKVRANHYEGLQPSASEAEIADAFRSAMSPLRPHRTSDIAAASVAYEALRDPLRRRAYDVSIGLRPEKDPAPRTPQGWHSVGSMQVGPVARPVADRLTPSAGQPAGPRQPAIMPEFDDAPVQWKRPAVLMTGMFVGVALIGAAAGLWAARDAQPDKPEKALGIGIPKAEAKPLTQTAPPAAAPVVGSNAKPAPGVKQVTESELVPPHAKRAAEDPPATEPEPLRADEAPEIPSEQVAAQAADAPPASSALPLSNATIARTLGRIGFSCGQVASTQAVEGGAFKVSCTSGESFKAVPVHGRYHFRKWSGR